MKVRYLLLLPITALLIQVSYAIASQARSPLSSASEQTSAKETPAPPWARNLNLSADQRSQLQTIHLQAIETGEQLHQQLTVEKEKLRSLLQSDASIEKLRAQYQQVQQIKQQLDNHQFERLLAERQVLTAEQLAIVIQEIKEGPQRRRSQ